MRFDGMKYSSIPLLSFVALASCSHYEAPELLPVKDKTFSGESLILYYNGEPMPNKSVTLTQSGDKATAKLFGEFDLSQLSAFGLSGTIPAPGVLPGEAVTTLELPLREDDDYWNFTGSGSNAACTFDFSGYFNSEKMALFISDAKLKGPGISPQVWKPAPIKVTDGEYTSIPFFINWQYDPIPGVDIDLSPYLQALTTLPVIPVYNNTAYMSVSQAMSLLLQTIAFKNDGNIIITYISSIGGASYVAQTYLNRFMYVMDSPTQVKLYLNPTALFGMILVAGSSGTPAEDVKIIGNGIYPSGHVTSTSPGAMEAILKSEIGKKIAASALSVILPRLADGLPFDVAVTDNQLHLTFDTEVALLMVKEILTPILADTEAVKALEMYIESSPTLKHLLPLFNKAMELIPQAIEQTNKFELGLALEPYK